MFLTDDYIEIDDFSGGITDFPLQASPRHLEAGDNVYIPANKKLRSRAGSKLLDLTRYLIDSSQRRIDSFALFNGDRELLAHSERDLFLLEDDGWSRLVGPDDGQALGAGSQFQQLSTAEWKGHLYFAGTGRGPVGKIFRDSTGAVRTLTAGLPKVVGPAIDRDDVLLLKCLALANDLRRALVDHMNDTSLHSEADKWSLSYFSAQSFTGADDEYPGPQPTPTPADVATDEESLYDLVEALSLAYEHHGYDPVNRYYHNSITVNHFGNTVEAPKGPFALLDTNARPETLEEAATQLDQIAQRYEWHRLAIFTHHAQNTYASIDRHGLVESKIGTIHADGYPVVEGDFTEFFNYVNALKSAFNAHMADEAHTQSQQSTHYATITLPDCNDLDSAFLLIYWLQVCYGQLHAIDARALPTGAFIITMDGTAGSANVTDVQLNGSPATLGIGTRLVSGSSLFTDASDTIAQKSATVSSSGAGTATLSKTLLGNLSDQTVQATASLYHVYRDGMEDPATVYELPEDELITDLLVVGNFLAVPGSTAAWLDLAADIFNALASHVGNVDVHSSQGERSIRELIGDDYFPFYKPEIGAYGYAFHYTHTYETQDGIEFLTRGAPVFAGPVESCTPRPLRSIASTGFTIDFSALADGQLSESGDFTDADRTVERSSTLEISHIHELINDASTNYQTDEVMVQIHRTIDDGNTYYLVDELENGTAEYSDTAVDDADQGRDVALSLRAKLYTSGGIVANEQPPRCRSLHLVEQTMYFLDVDDGTTRLRGRVVQSIPGAPESGPATFFDDLEDEGVAMSSSEAGVPVALCRKGAYRLENGFVEDGGGFLRHRKIAGAKGCVSAASVVKTPYGIFYAGTDGIYLTDGFRAVYLSRHLRETYKRLVASETQASRISGCYVEHLNQIWWSVQSEPSMPDVDRILVLHLDFGIQEEASFTVHTFEAAWNPTALVEFEGDLLRGDARGVVFRHHDDYKADPDLPADVTAAITDLDDWGRVHIPYRVKPVHLDMGNVQKGQWTSKVHILGENHGNVALQIYSIRDNNQYRKKALEPILFRVNPTWGDPGVIFDETDYPSRADRKLDAWRRFPGASLRSQVRQLELVPADIAVYRYQDWPVGFTADVDGTAKTATLNRTAAYVDPVPWPADVVGMRIAFQNDGYETEFDITAVDEDEITFDDPDDQAPTSASVAWVIRGIPKEQRLHISSIAIHLGSVGMRGERYGGPGDRGENEE